MLRKQHCYGSIADWFLCRPVLEWCSGHGNTTFGINVCDCDFGYFGDDCSQEVRVRC